MVNEDLKDFFFFFVQKENYVMWKSVDEKKKKKKDKLNCAFFALTTRKIDISWKWKIIKKKENLLAKASDKRKKTQEIGSKGFKITMDITRLIKWVTLLL